MEIPVYVTTDEVKRVCQALNIGDWTGLTEAKVLPDEAEIILAEVKSIYRRLAQAKRVLAQTEADQLA